MATDAKPKFQNPDFRPIPQHPTDYGPPPPDLAAAATSSHDGLHFWQFMIAGSVAGMVEHMAMFPVDTVKTHMQPLGSCPIKSVGIQQANFPQIVYYWFCFFNFMYQSLLFEVFGGINLRWRSRWI